jgi:integrase
MTTYASYAQITHVYIVPYLGHVSLQKLAPAMLQALYARLLSGEGERRPLSSRTVRYTHAVIRMALKEALRLGLVARNVADAVSPPKAARPQVKAWDAPELRHFLEVAGADRYSPLWLLAAHTGMRQGELLGLRWQDIDLGRGIARVVQTVPTHHHGVEFGVPKTASGRRTIALDATCIVALRAHRASQNERRLAMGEVWQDYDLVFTSGIGTPLNQGGVYHRFIALARKANVPRIPFHGLRHSHATVLMKQGVNPKVVSERLGHADISITLQTYSHVLPQMQQEAAAIFEAAMGDG